MKRFLPSQVFMALALVLFVLFALIGSSAFAATATGSLTWTRPTSYTDGTALPASAIEANKVLCTFTPTGGAAAPCTITPTTLAGSVVAGSVALTYPAVGGRACFQIVVVTGGIDADPSPITANSCKDFPAVKANPAGSVTVVVTVSVSP